MIVVMESIMSKAYLVLPLILGTAFIQSCTSVPLTLAHAAVKAAMPVEGAPESAVAYYQVARYHEARGELDYAAAAYERSRALDPSFYEATNALGVVHARQGKLDQAIAELQSAVQQAPAAGHIYNNLGYAYYLKARYVDAITAFQKAGELDPGNARPQRNLALVYDKTGQRDKAALAMAKAASLAPRPTPGADASVTAAQETTKRAPAAAPVSAPVAAVMTRQGDSTLSAAARREPGGPASSRSGTPTAVGGLVAVAPNIYELRIPPAPVVVPVQDVTRTILPAVSAHETAASRVRIKPFRLEVSNGNGSTGMAHRIAGNLKAAGLNPVRLTNQIPWRRVSEIQFTEGYAAEAAHLAGMLGQDVLTIRNDRLRSDIKVRLVLGKDVQREAAFVMPGLHRTTTVASAK